MTLHFHTLYTCTTPLLPIPCISLSLSLSLSLPGCAGASSMGTEVMHPHDILSSRALGGAPSTAAATLLPRRRQSPVSFSGASPNPKLNRRAEPKKRREGSPRPVKNSGGSNGGSLEMGQVMILKRGEALESKAGGTTRGKARKEERRGGGGGDGLLSSPAVGDLVVFGTGQIGSDLVAVPKKIRVPGTRKGAKPSGLEEKYAGSGFSSSPSPRALPLPTFSFRRASECGEGVVDLSATMDLRRLLRLS